MRKLVLMMLLAGACTAAAAAWEPVGENKELSRYADPATIRKSGNMVQIWALLDYKTTQVFEDRPYLSVKELVEFDCANGRLQLLTIFAYSDHLAKGNIIHRAWFDFEEWQPVRRGTTNEALSKFACAKR